MLLAPDEAEPFFKLHRSLMFFVNERFGVVPTLLLVIESETHFSNRPTRTTMQADTTPDPRREPCPKRNYHPSSSLAMRFG